MTYEHALTKWDHAKIDKLNKLTNTETFWEDVYQLRKRVTKKYTLHCWGRLAKIRWKELNEEVTAKKFEIRKTDWLRSCASCGASNYENPGRKAVDIIYEIKIGCMVNALCPDCMLKLANQISEEVEI